MTQHKYTNRRYLDALERSILVQTGDGNQPALSLYRKNGYEEYDLVLKKRLQSIPRE